MKLFNIKLLAVGMLTSIFASSCSNLDESAMVLDDGNKVIYAEPFVSGIGKFTHVSVTGNQVWQFDAAYSCMVMTGYADTTGTGTKVNIENEDWLISPSVDLSGLSTAKLSFEHAGRYFATIAGSTTVLISEDYIEGLPSTGTWTELTITKNITNTDFTFVVPQISLSAYVGKKVRIAFKYNSTSTKAGTWELKNFSVSAGEAVLEEIADNGKGTEAAPFNVAGATANQGISAWVKGYIVGYVWSGAFTNFVFGADTCTQATNLLIADTIGSIYVARCVPVQLPTGAIRTALNLPVNKSLIGQKVTLYGSLESYFGTAGLKTVTYAVMPDSTKIGVKPVEPIYSETFASNSKGSFTIENKTLPAAITSVWNTSATYGMVATGYKTPTNYDSEGWLISPEIDLTNQTTAKLRFDHAINYVIVANMSNEMTLQITSDNGVSWSPIVIPVYPTGANWTYVNSGEMNLSAYLGMKVKIALVYKSTVAKAGTWEVKNFMVYK